MDEGVGRKRWSQGRRKPRVEMEWEKSEIIDDEAYVDRCIKTTS